MSRTRRSSSKPSPVTRRFQWKGDGSKGGYFAYYDKDLGEEVKVEDFSFTVLDQRSGVTGWSNSEEARIWSNHISNMAEETLVVRAGSKKLCEGLYGEIKECVHDCGGKYGKFLYVMFDGEDGEPTIGSIQLTGSGLGSWITFDGDNDTVANSVSVTGFEDLKKGAVKYRTPIFEAVPAEQTTLDAADALDAKLQDYFDSLTPSAAEKEEEEASDDTIVDSEGKKKEILF